MMQITFRQDEVEIPAVCPVCKMCGGVPRLDVDGVEYGTKHLELSECMGCGTLYFTSLDPVIGYDYSGFEEDYWLNYVQSGAGITAMLEPLLAVASQREGGKLLDVGCGFGFIPDFWERRGYGQAVGLETSLYGKVGKEKLGITIHHVYYADAHQISGEKFDYVYSSEVLEHVPEPAAFITEISEALSDKGILVLTTPCADAIKPDTPYPDIIATLSPGFHYFVTRENALRQLLQQSGFIHVHIHNSGSRLFAWASRQPLPHIEYGFRYWEEYYDYLETLSQNPDPHVAGGALYRLVKDTLNNGQLDLTKDALDRWTVLARTAYGLDFLAPQDIESRFTATTELRNREFPSWLGCGLHFYVRAVMQLGGDPQLLLAPARSAVTIMEHEIAQFAQFAQEPAHFLPHAKDKLGELEAMTAAAIASDTRPQFARAPSAKHTASRRAVSLLCGYAPDGRPSPALVALCQAMTRHGIDVHVCVAVNPTVESIDMNGLEEAATIALRQNDSYDFGVWSAQLAALPEIWGAERIIFANDSILLVNDKEFSVMMDKLHTDETEFIALTESHTPSYHTQSYFFQLRGAALSDWRIRGFWAGISPNLDKLAIINKYELGLIKAIQQNINLRTKVLFGYQRLFPGKGADQIIEGNMSHFLWERLLLNGMPFIKAELLHSNPLRLPLGHSRLALLDTGADFDMIDRHLREMDRTRSPSPQKKETALNVMLKRALGKKRFQRLREWNRRRRSRRHAKRDKGR